MRLIRIRVADYELRELYDAMGIDAKLEAGCLREQLKEGDVADAKRFDGTSFHITLIDKRDAPVARIHYIIATSGRLRHWPTYVQIRNVRIFRDGHQQPPWSRWRLRLRWEIGHLRRRIEQARAR